MHNRLAAYAENVAQSRRQSELGVEVFADDRRHPGSRRFENAQLTLIEGSIRDLFFLRTAIASGARVYVDRSKDIVANKIEVEGSDPAATLRQREEVIGLDVDDAISISAKTGEGVIDLLEAVVQRIPPPSVHPDEDRLRALIVDSWYDSYRGVVVLVRIVSGEVKGGMKVDFMATEFSYDVAEVGVFKPVAQKVQSLKSGEVGYVIFSIK